MPTENATLQKLTLKAGGLLPADVYSAIYQAARRNRPKCIVEIGTAHGAATIALALGALEEGPGATVWTVDMLGGEFSSRSRFGTPEQNRRIVLRNLEAAGVDLYVNLFVGSSEDFANSGNCPESIDMLMLDADGRIDRDLLHFYSKLTAGAPVIIDDADDLIKISHNHAGRPHLDLKHKITSILVSRLVHDGYLTDLEVVGSTAFCKRGERQFEKHEFMELSLNCYRELIFAYSEDKKWAQICKWSQKRDAMRKRIKKLIPSPVYRSAAKARAYFG